MWATVYGLGGYVLGKAVHHLAGPVRLGTIALAIVALLAGIILLRRNEERLEAEAERARHGPLDAYQHSSAR